MKNIPLLSIFFIFPLYNSIYYDYTDYKFKSTEACKCFDAAKYNDLSLWCESLSIDSLYWQRFMVIDVAGDIEEFLLSDGSREALQLLEDLEDIDFDIIYGVDDVGIL